MEASPQVQSLLSSENEIWLRITAITFKDDSVLIEVQASDEYSQDDYGAWGIEAVGLLAHEVTDLGGDFELLSKEHVLDRELTDRRHSLYINGAASCPDEVVGRLYLSHATSAADWIPFGRYLNECCDPGSVLKAGHGLIAKGPEFLIDCYDQVLREFKIGTSRPPSHPAMVWDGAAWQEVPSAVSGILIGSSYFIATKLKEAKRG